MPPIFFILLLAPILFWAPIFSYAIELDEPDFEDSQITYLSPTRLKQSAHDTPASVSRITQETIRKLQINTIPEIFRYVAGMITVPFSGNHYVINYQTANGFNVDHMQIFLDGISVSRPSYALGSWTTLPITVDDIDYIEVTRSPSAATYGINSLSAVVNIVTKDPLSSAPFTASASTGGNNYDRLNLAFSGNP